MNSLYITYPDTSALIEWATGLISDAIQEKVEKCDPASVTDISTVNNMIITSKNDAIDSLDQVLSNIREKLVNSIISSSIELDAIRLLPSGLRDVELRVNNCPRQFYTSSVKPDDL